MEFMMKIHTAQEIKAICRIPFPQINQIWGMDREYKEITIDKIKKIAATINPELRRVHGDVWDCEDIARHLIDVIRYNNLKDGDKQPDAIGSANGLRFAGVTEPHMAIFFIQNSQMWLFEPQTFEHWLPQVPDDFIFKLDY